MKDKKPSKIKKAFSIIKNYRVYRALNNAQFNIEELAQNDEGFLVECGDSFDDKGDVRVSPVSLIHTGKAFHEEVWYNMSAIQQVTAMMWLEGHFAEIDNRKEAIFDINSIADDFEVRIEGDNFIFVVPEEIFEETKMFPFDFANLVVTMCAEAKVLDRKMKFDKTGEIIDIKREVLENLDIDKQTPNCYKKFVDGKTLTEQERQEIKEHLDMPYMKEYRQMTKELVRIADANEQYIGPDSFYEGFKEEAEYHMYLEDEFLKNFRNEKGLEVQS